MARRRMFSQELISDEHFNSCSVEAQNIFVRMLIVSDDCGVVPTSVYKLNVLINTPKEISQRLEDILVELVKNGLGHLFLFKQERFFAFKPSAFEEYQSYILKKATKSEYLRIPKEEFYELAKTFRELPRTSIHTGIKELSTVESKKQKVVSNQQENQIQNIWIQSWGRNPKIPEVEDTMMLIEKFGAEKVLHIFKEAVRDGFNKLKTLINSLDDKGNIVPKDEKEKSKTMVLKT